MFCGFALKKNLTEKNRAINPDYIVTNPLSEYLFNLIKEELKLSQIMKYSSSLYKVSWFGLVFLF